MSSSSFMSRLLYTAMSRLLLSSAPITKRGGRMVKISEEVSQARVLKKPIVALESALVCGGLEYPHNFDKVKELEAKVRENGAVPAMIAILDGVACIGLSDDELKRLAEADVPRTAFRDIAHVMAKRECGGTTVSATAFFAKLVGIPVVVAITDIASDMSEFGNTSVAVVCGGAESATDTPRMLEHLACVGTCVAAYQATAVIPFPDLQDEVTLHQQELRCLVTVVPPRAEPVKAPHCAESIEECARLIEAHNELMMGKGMLIAVPIEPSVKCAHGLSAYNKAVHEAWVEKNLEGKEEMDFTRVKTQKIKNLLLAVYIAEVGAQIAVSLSTAG